ncbi:MAG: RHS repeat domain-containing protein, partial [Candidatus Thorarchaeota archaeon]
ILDLTIQYDYDLQNNLIAISHYKENCLLEKTTFFYDIMGNKILEIDPLGNTTKYHYDLLGRLIKKTSLKTEKSQIWTYTYNIFDYPIKIIDPLKNTKTIEYNVRGKPTRITEGNRREESFIYSLEGSLYRHITLQGITKIFEYDYLGRTTKIKYYKRGSKKNLFKSDTYYYDAFKLLSESTSNGDIKYLYNNKGELIQTIFAQNDSEVWWSRKGIADIEDGEVTDFIYDSLGRLIKTKKWKDNTHYTLYAKKYDLLGHLIEERIENEQQKLLYKKQFTYLPSGELFQEIGFPNNKETVLKEYTYDPLGRLSRIKKGNSIWNINYEKNHGSLKKIVKDPFNSVTEEVYNGMGLLESRIKRDQNLNFILEEQFDYGLLNNLIQEKNSDFAISYEHTSDGLCKSILFSNMPSSFKKQESIQHFFKYNSYGELINNTTPSFKKAIEYKYDSKGYLNRIIYQETPNGKAKHYKITSDKKGNVTKVVKKGSFNLEKTYNTNNQILTEEINDKWGSYNISFKYDSQGYLTEIILPDHSIIQYIYEGPFVSKIRRLSREDKELYIYEITDRDLMGNILYEMLPKNLGVRKNIYNDQGRKVEISSDFFSDKVVLDSLGNTIEKHTKQGKEKRKTLFTYDRLSQLISEEVHTYKYDQLQNLILKDNISYTITPYNQIIKGDDFKCEYDACGNIKTLSDSSNTQKMQFDALGRLILSKTSKGEKVRYIYDFDSRRISKEIDNEDSERYFYLGEYELGALDEDGNIKSLRIPINPNSLDNTSILSIELENEVYIPFLDLQKNVCCLVDLDRRTIVESYKFSAFGEEQIFSPRKQVSESQINNPWRFQGKRHDNETGLIYYGARYYYPKIQKWISPDPIGSHDSLNLYLFCHNNPLKYHDLWGFSSKVNKSCQCGYCVRGEGWCHCRGEDLHNNISKCACRGISCVCKLRGSLSGVIIAVADFAVDTWHNPYFQGGLQAFGGLAEAMIGGGVALSSIGIGAPLGGVVMTHGLDHFFTGLQTAFSGNLRNSVTNQLLQKTGLSSQTASMIDSGMSIVGSMGGIAAVRASKTTTILGNKLNVNLKSIKTVESNENFQYHPRIRARAIHDPIAHNFPYSFDKVILKTKPIKRIDGSLLYRHTGILNGKQGIYEIGLNPDTGIIFHRTFRGVN